MLEVRDTEVVGLHGWIVVDGRVLHDQSWFGDAFETQVGDAWPPDLTPVRLPGVTLTLVSEWANINYSHLLFDAIPRLDLFERSGYSIDKVDTILCPTPIHGIPRWTQLGLDPSRIVYADPKVTYETETLLAPNFPGARFVLSSWAAGFLRDRLSVPAEGQHRRLYIPRTTTRLLTNEADVWAILEAHGFETVDPGTSPRDARAAFAAADLVVGAHGAGFVDTVFCPVGTPILEFIPTDHPFPFYFSSAVACGLRHHYLVGESESHRPPGEIQSSLANFHVETELLKRAIQRLIYITDTGESPRSSRVRSL